MNPADILQFAFKELEKRYPAGAQYDFLISEKIQLEEIEKLKYTLKYEQFFFVVNLHEKKIEHVHGVGDWLGYLDKKFGLPDYFKIIHPRHLASLNMSAQSVFDTANSNKFKLGFMNPWVVVQLPILHTKGKYILVKRSLYPFQIDKISGKVTSYLNHFTLLREYNEMDTLELRVSNPQIIRTQNESLEVKENVSKNLETSKKLFGLNDKEIEILKLIAQNPAISQIEIANTLDISISTLKKTTNSRILTKARDFFQIDAFKNLKEVALYMKKEGIL